MMNNPIIVPTYHSDGIVGPLAPGDWPSIDHIETEDDAPMDNVFSEKQMRLLTEPLYTSWKPEQTFVALSNVGLFYGVDLPALVPDVLLSVGVRLPEDLFPKLHRSYFIWKYGRPPDVAIVIVSNNRGGEDTHKLSRYADARVANYIIFDPEQHLSDTKLRLYRLQQSQLVLDDSREFKIPTIGLGVKLWSGRYEQTDSLWLRWSTLDGELIATGSESTASAQEQVKAEALRADAAEQETARLLELLRKHGIQ